MINRDPLMKVHHDPIDRLSHLGSPAGAPCKFSDHWSHRAIECPIEYFLNGQRGEDWRVIRVLNQPQEPDEVARRLREAFGLARTGARIHERVRKGLLAAAREGIIVKSEEFWSMPGDELGHVRDRRQSSMTLRQAGRIAPPEYRLAVQIAVDDAVSLTRAELIVQAARLFGFDRTGPDLRAAIDNAINELDRSQVIIEIGGKFRRMMPA